MALGLTYEIEVLEELTAKECLPDAEREWIAEARRQGAPLTNCTDGGEGMLNPIPEVRAKMGTGWKGKHLTPEMIESLSRQASLRTGEKNGFYGREHSRETRQKISESASQRTGVLNHFFGRKHSEETLCKLRARVCSEETKAKMRKPKSEEARRNMSEAAKHRKVKSEITKARQVLDPRAAAKRLWASISDEERRKKMDYARSRFEGHTEEHKAAVSEASKRRWAEWKATGRDREIGRNISEGLRKKRAAQ